MTVISNILRAFIKPSFRLSSSFPCISSQLPGLDLCCDGPVGFDYDVGDDDCDEDDEDDEDDEKLLKDCLRASTTLSVKSSTTLCAPLKKITVIVILPRWSSWVGRPLIVVIVRMFKKIFSSHLYFLPAASTVFRSFILANLPILRDAAWNTKVGNIMSCIKNKISNLCAGNIFRKGS